MLQKNLKSLKISWRPSQTEFFQVKSKHEELTAIMRAATALRQKDKENKKIEEKMKKLEGDLMNPKFAIMMSSLFPMANLSMDQIDKKDPLKTLQKLCMGFEKSLKDQEKAPLKITGKFERETELLQALKVLLRNKTDNLKLKTENGLLKQKRELLLANKKYSNMPALKKLRLSKLKEELDETDKRVNSILDQNAKLSKCIEDWHRVKQRCSNTKIRYLNKSRSIKYSRNKSSSKKMLELES